ncbi:cobyric acid synthase CobQ [Dictyobacter sp. S3.2.2.5]|uniref:Cobyric acid synthase n=1 Tax=Dictyobacter halimunensis TaxID=3026934 RepID=A0ABQ6FNU9_9CHLR|nr:cobyric acid synthase CobQ [Dictyobacter sp. S3.2.2.5]
MNLARTLMIQGTASSVGKSTLVIGLCRLFAQEGYRVAPFKAQNMSLNAAVTSSGGEIGRAQATQAEAAGIEPTVEMNPILLKPESYARSQVIVMGRPLGTMEARAYYQQRTGFDEIVQSALITLRQSVDLVIIEGAGSPVEINLAQYDLVNMRVAALADAPVLLVGDIDQGGIFATLLGTLMLLQPEERARVKGLIVNKFRGDFSLWREGERMLAARSGIPVLGTLPFLERLHIAEEDSVSLQTGTAALLRQQQQSNSAAVDIVLVRFPYLSNYDEFDALAADPRVHLHVVAHPHEFPPHPDLILLPGTKNTFSDLAWLWRQGLAQHIRQCSQQGIALLGICGGYQMLGERVSDPSGVEAEAGSVEAGLGLLPLETVFGSLDEKVTQRSQASVDPQAKYGLFANVEETQLQGYQIHVGQTRAPVQNGAPGHAAFRVDARQEDGWIDEEGWCAGCSLHGLFENDQFRQAVLSVLVQRRSSQRGPLAPITFSREHEYDRLAEMLRRSLDLHALTMLCQLTKNL